MNPETVVPAICRKTLRLERRWPPARFWRCQLSSAGTSSMLARMSFALWIISGMTSMPVLRRCRERR